ncbi:cellulose synthase subunit BcsC-related outer membrane protein [Gluconacetobacter sp. Hr-1-5]|uniref:cellulose biosynthesis protein BcsC n=1 Tax=Gluconacetobacter sp. Hr-1-5 TaxID=3395370 RepID=UPI003B5258B8
MRAYLTGMTMLGGLVAWAPGIAYSHEASDSTAPAISGGAVPTSEAEARLSHARSVLDLVLEQGHYWIDAGQFVRAHESIQRALAIQPTNTDALSMLCVVQIGTGDVTAAQQTLSRLAAAGGSATQLSRLRAALKAGPVDQKALAEARKLAGSGSMLAAMLRYRALFHNGEPPPALALEYYRVLGGTILGYNDARTRLSALVAESPHDLNARLALAQIQTYRDTSRAQGLAELRRLAGPETQPLIRNQAIAAWHATLSWVPIVGASIPLYMDWLALHPDDTAIVTRLEKARAVQATIDEGNDRTEGFVLLEQGRLDAANAAFQRALSVNPQDADVLGGLGLVAQRHRQIPLARRYFHQAIDADAGRASHWRAALSALNAVGGNDPQIVAINRLAAAGRYDAARTALTHLARRPEMAFAALLMTAGLDRLQGRTAEAEQLYRKALQRRPADPNALFNLADLLYQAGQLDEARTLAARVAILRPALLPRLQAADYTARAARAGTDAEQIALLRQALGRVPGDPWLTLRLAQALYHNGQPTEARSLMEALTRNPHAPPASLQAGVTFAMNMRRYEDAAVLLDRLPPAGRNAAMRRAADLVAFSRQVAAAPKNDTRSIRAMADQPDPTGNRAAMLVDALLARHDREGARWVLAHESAITLSATPAQKLLYAGLALRLEAPADAQRELDAYDRLVRAEGLPPTADAALARADLAVGVMIQRSDAEIRAQRPREAYRLLAPIVSLHPDSTAAWLALGRVYHALNQPQMALRADQEALRRGPKSVDALAAVAQDTLALDDRLAARAMERRLMASAPRRSTTWQIKAQNDRADGLDRQQKADLVVARQLQCDAEQDRACAPAVRQKPDYRWPDIETAYVPLRGAPLPATEHYLPEDGPVGSMNRQIVYLQESTAPQLDANTYVRSRTGTAGLGQLTELAVPITGTIPFESWQHRISFSVTPTFLFTGDPLRNTYSADRFGTVPLYGSGFARHHAYDVQGVGLDVRYVNHWFAADVGSSPLGFPLANVLGGVEFSPRLTDNLTLRITGDRRMVTDSELSYAGMRDPGTGREWGAVTRVGGHGQLEWANERWNAYAGGGFGLLEGTHVVDNTEIDAELGGSVTVWQQRQRQRLRLGVNAEYLAYHRNEYEFTYGQGGYFSPQSYYAIMPSAEYTGHIGRWTWLVMGNIGYQNYHVDSTSYFPLDPTMQRMMALPGPNRYDGQGASGIAGTGRARIVYQLTDRLRLGAEGQYVRSGNWSEASGMLMAHYRFGNP